MRNEFKNLLIAEALAIVTMIPAVLLGVWIGHYL